MKRTVLVILNFFLIPVIFVSCLRSTIAHQEVVTVHSLVFECRTLTIINQVKYNKGQNKGDFLNFVLGLRIHFQACFFFFVYTCLVSLLHAFYGCMMLCR